MEEKKENANKLMQFENFGKELGRFEGETFYIAEYEFGAVYHVYNSMTLFVSSSQTSCFETLVDYVRNKDVYAKLEGKDKEDFDLMLSAVGYILSSPLYAFSSIDLTFDMASLIVNHIKKTFDMAIEAQLQDETKEEDAQFKSAVLGFETIKEEMNKE